MIVSSPGRINIIGEHVDYNDGFVLPFAINKRIWVEVVRSSFFEVNSEAYGTVKIKSIEKTSTWADYILGVLNEIEQRGFKVPPLKIKIWGDLPSGMGLSSSAALETATAFAVSELLSLNLDKSAVVEIAVRAERNFVGVQCGIMDQYTAVFGEKGQALLIDTMKITHELIPLNMGNYIFAVVDSGVKHSLASGEYNKRRAETQEALKILGKSSYRDVKRTDIDRIQDPVLKKRASHVIDEIERTVKAADYLKSGEMSLLGELLYKSHESLSKLYEVSCEETDFIVEFLRNNGITGARIIGGGFGGSVLILDEKERVKRVFEEMKQKYSNRFRAQLKLLFVESSSGVRKEGD